MYLSKIARPPSGSSFHKLIMWGFPATDDPSPRQKWGVLHRVDGRFILVQSKIEPVWPALLDTQVKPYELTLESDRRYRFRLAINPVIQSKQGRSPIDPITWLRAKDLGAEFEVCKVTQSDIVERSWRAGRARRVPLAVATLDGYLTCTDPDRLQEAITDGIGRARAYGCGLLSVVPV